MPSGTFAIRQHMLVPDPEKPNFFNAVTKHGVVSQQPNGEIEFRPLGTHGAYEEFYIDGKEAIFPDVDGLTFIVPYRK